jgi:hypothetical protein
MFQGNGKAARFDKRILRYRNYRGVDPSDRGNGMVVDDLDHVALPISGLEHLGKSSLPPEPRIA